MRYEDTEPAGGDPKNRLADRVVHLEAGDYTVYFVTDGSHSAAEWNASAPPDGGRWGITLLAASGHLDPSAVTTHAEAADPSIVAQLVRVRDNERSHDLVHPCARERRPDLRASAKSTATRWQTTAGSRTRPGGRCG